jgi:hypothetical protein
MLHIAPEAQLSRFFQKAHLSADLSAAHGMVQMDITDIQYLDNTFDVVYQPRSRACVARPESDA